MSVTFQIEALNAAEYEALESEGSPSVNFSNYNAYRLFSDMGLLSAFDGEGCYMVDPEEIFEGFCRLNSLTGSDMFRYRDLLRVADAARKLGRRVMGV